MAKLNFRERKIFEELLDRDGYVLDFTDKSFAEFFLDYFIDIADQKYKENGPSKMNRLRTFWVLEPDKLVGEVLEELINYADSISTIHQNNKNKALEITRKLQKKGSYSTEEQFLGQNFEYCNNPLPYENPVAFISHDSRDKETIVRPIVDNLLKKRIPVWFDEYSLKPGAKLSESIDQGIKRCSKCILILSKNFLSNTGWTKKEFRTVLTKEIIEKNNVIIPVWCNVNKEDVYNYNADLADTLGIQWNRGVFFVCNELERVLGWQAESQIQ